VQIVSKLKQPDSIAAMRECQDLPLADRQFTARSVPSVAMAA
jgi:hypothetical protein